MCKQVPKLIAFFLALSIGAIAVTFLSRESEAVVLRTMQVSVEPSTDLPPEFAEIEFDDRTKHPSMALEFVTDGQVGHCTANSAVEEKNWLVLLNRSGNFSLEKRSVTYGNVSRSDFGSFSNLKFAQSRSAVFMLTDQGTLNPGPVTTLFLKRPPPDDGMELYIEGLENGKTREFSLGEKHYWLRVAGATLKGGQSVYALVLKHATESQVIWFKSSDTGEVAGDLEWVGDLDGDDSLDLLFTSYAQNGGQLEGFLLLSSFAVERSLVGLAGFYSARCTS